MTTITASARPAWFDAKLLSYMPGLRSRAAKMELTREKANDLVTDKIISAMQRWETYRVDGGFWSWLVFTMRQTFRDKIKFNNAAKRPQIVFSDMADFTNSSAPATQENAVLLSEVLRNLEKSKHGKTLLRRVAGDGLAQIAADSGYSVERIRQKEIMARAYIRKRYGMAA